MVDLPCVSRRSGSGTRMGARRGAEASPLPSLASRVCRAAIRREARPPGAGPTEVIRGRARRRRANRHHRRQDVKKDLMTGEPRVSSRPWRCSRAFSYLTTSPHAVENFRHGGISPTVACPARHREAGRRHRPAPATAADFEGMGLRRIYHHVDCGDRGALSGSRRPFLGARRVAREPGGLYVTRPVDRRGFRESDFRERRGALMIFGRCARHQRMAATSREGNDTWSRLPATLLFRPAGHYRRRSAARPVACDRLRHRRIRDSLTSRYPAYPRRTAWFPRARSGRRQFLCSPVVVRQFDRESSAAGRLVRRYHTAAVQLDEVSHDCEAETGAARILPAS